MSEPRRSSFDGEAHCVHRFAPTRAEINFLWSFIQGSITIPETWNALMRSYGFCERHAWIHISVEMSFRDEYLLGPAILYSELIEKALSAVSRLQSVGQHSLEHALRSRGPCFLCSMNLRNSASAGAAPGSRLDRGRDISTLRAFAGRTAPVWRSWLCPKCAGHQYARLDPTLCRQHLIAAMRARTPVDISAQGNMLQDLFDHVAHYQDFVSGWRLGGVRSRSGGFDCCDWLVQWMAALACATLVGGQRECVTLSSCLPWL
jgi:hypothetical protein